MNRRVPRVTPHTVLPIRSRVGRAVLLAGLVAAVFNANVRAINARDTAIAEYTALAIATTGTVNLDAYPAIVAAGTARGYVHRVDGHARSAYPVLPSLVAAPAYWIALRAGVIDAARPDVGIEAVGKVVASLLVALACAVLYLTLTTWRPAAPASLLVLACALATPLWSSASQALWSHAPAALLLAAGLGLALTAPQITRRGEAMALAGVCLALAVACRPLLAMFPVGVAVGLLRERPARQGWLPFGFGVVAGVAAAAAVNGMLYGRWLGGTGRLYTDGVTIATHGVAHAWSGDWLSGLAGLLVSPNRGVLIYMPAVLVAAAGVPVAWRAGGVARYGVVLGTAGYVVLWAKYAIWWGGQTYGPRLASDIAVPLALLASYAVVPWRSHRPVTRAAVAAALVWSVMVQAVGAVCYPAGNWDSVPRDVDLAHERLWDWRDLQIVRVVTAGPYWQAKAQRPAPIPVARRASSTVQ